MNLTLLPYLYKLHQIRKNQRRDYLQIKRIQEKKLKLLLCHAYCNVEYYRKLFQQKNILPQDIKCLEDLVKIPLTDRESIQALPKEEITARGINLKRCGNLRTSGSSGVPLNIFVSRREAVWWSLSRRTLYFESGGRLHDRELIIVAPESFPLGQRQWLGSLNILKTKSISIFTDTEYKLKAMLDFNPTIITSYVSILKDLASEIKKRGIKNIKPKIIFSTAELMTEKDRELIRAAFQSSVFNYYSCNECGIISWECQKHNGLHLNIDNVIVEVIKEDGTQANYGENGEIVVTGLNNYTMPFIRYRLKDTGMLLKEQCSCGRGSSLIKIAAGRTNDYIRLPAGNRISPYFLTCEIENIPGVARYQIVQEKIDSLKIRIIKDADFSQQTITRITNSLRRLLGRDIGINIALEEVILPDVKTGKFRIIGSLLDV